jgi:hypothetical protein
MRRFSIVLLFLALVSAVAAGGAGAQGYVVVVKSGANPSDVAALNGSESTSASSTGTR